ncbi:Biopterin transporter family [Dillenia turbinata]|uniref:Biopterin transporter family n=1 Tax=Dillenia turbinata TaxID=194707 RepID=A0AAN8VHB8_9MAGN
MMTSLETEELLGKPKDLSENPPSATPTKETDTLQEDSPTKCMNNILIINPIALLLQPLQWLQMLGNNLNPSFIVGVFIVYGFSQGFAGSYFRVVSDYYWKDVQKVQPSTVQVFIGLYSVPLILKPIWGLLTDVVPIKGYRRRPYFVLAGIMGLVSALIASSLKLQVGLALACLMGVVAGVAIADVIIDACIAKSSIENRALAADLQSLCGFCTSVGALVGYSTSGLFVHKLGPKGALAILAIPPAAVMALGFFIYETRTTVHPQSENKHKAMEKVGGAIGDMLRAIRCPRIWQPSLYMYLSLAFSIRVYWDHICNWCNGIYNRDLPFRNLLFFAQLLYALSGMLDVIFVLRWNLALGIPDYVFVITEECVSRIVSRIRWTPMMVLSSQLCPPGVEGTFFALLMCIDSLGSVSSKWGGGLVLHLLHVTRIDFKNLWLALLIRNILRTLTLGFIFLVPKADELDALFASHSPEKQSSCAVDGEGVQLVQSEKIEV